MSQKSNPFEGAKSFTLKQFKSEKKFEKTCFNRMTTTKADGSKPIFYKNADGTPTNIQKVAVRDEAGNRVATMSREVASDLFAGKDIKHGQYPLKYQEYFYDRHNPETGEPEEDVKGVVLMYNKPNSSNEILIADFDED